MKHNKSKIDYNYYANIIIRAFRKYIDLKNKNVAFGGNNGLGKWLIICESKHFDGLIYDEKLLWLGNIIGVTGWKIWQDKNINSKKTCSICVYCGINENILLPNKQYKWILNIGEKLLKSKMLQTISIRDSIYFKENLKTRNNIYSHNSSNATTLKLDFDYKCDFLD